MSIWYTRKKSSGLGNKKSVRLVDNAQVRNTAFFNSTSSLQNLLVYLKLSALCLDQSKKSVPLSDIEIKLSQV